MQRTFSQVSYLALFTMVCGSECTVHQDSRLSTIRRVYRSSHGFSVISSCSIRASEQDPLPHRGVGSVDRGHPRVWCLGISGSRLRHSALRVGGYCHNDTITSKKDFTVGAFRYCCLLSEHAM